MEPKKIKIQNILENSFIYLIKDFKRIFIPFFLIYIFFSVILILLLYLFNFNSAGIKMFLKSSSALKSSLLYYTPIIIVFTFLVPILYSFTSIIIIKNHKGEDYSFKSILFLFLKKSYYLIPVLIICSLFELLFSLFIIPGLILSTFMLFYPIELFSENNSILSLKNSFALVKKHFFKSMLFILILFVVQLLFLNIIDCLSNYLFPVYTYTFFDNLSLFRNNILAFTFLRFCLFSLVFIYIINCKTLFYINFLRFHKNNEIVENIH